MPQREAALHVDTLAIEGGLFTAEWLTKVAAQQAPAQADADYGVRAGFTLREEIALAWRSAQALWSQFNAARVQPHHDAWGVTQRFTTELLRQCFAFQLQQATHPRVIDERHYPVPFSALGGRVPLVLSPHDETKPLDSAQDRLGDNSGDRVRRRSAFGLLQETLNAQSDALWGLATNGVLLRIARDNASLTRPAWVEVDLERLFVEERFADFSVLWLLLHASRFGSDGGAATDCALEQWRSSCREQGTRAREALRLGVEQALLVLGQGFVSHPANVSLRQALSTGALDASGKLGNLTLTGFNSELEAKPFHDKKQHPEWGYIHSPVWLSKSIASEDSWGPEQIDKRGDLLAQKAVQVWRPVVADPAMLKTLELDDEKERSSAFSLEALKWATGTREWFDELRETVLSCAEGALELPRAKSVVYRAPDWIVEVLPRAKGFTIRFAADASDLIEIAPEVQDAAAWVFITNSTVSGGSLYTVSSPAQLAVAKALVARTCQLMFEPT